MSKDDAHHHGATDPLARLDALLQHRSRLGACALLATAESLSFSRLRQLLDETDGNLGAQLRKLEDAGYLEARKEFMERKPVTWYRLTPAGRKALERHFDAMSELVKSTRRG